ncbi:MAG: hypothetical protein HOP04_12740 [Methylophilaceae bacterium]|nr:hypothetical protein [Methylophilaceae bacterium]
MTVAIQFYIPLNEEAFSSLPTSINDYWEWQLTALGISQNWGQYHWVVQTYIHLKASGLNVILTNKLPHEGILITHRDCLKYDFIPTNNLFVVVLLVDRDVPLPYAQLHVTHNPVQKLHLGQPYFYMPPWPQIGLIPRDTKRGEIFTNIVYHGYSENLDEKLRENDFLESIQKLGLSITYSPPAHWHDFSHADVILAIRKLGIQEQYLNKPSLKLYNAWLAGVPAIMGYETSYRAEGKINVNYIEATSTQDVLDALKKLKQNPSLVKELVDAGKKSVELFSTTQTVEKWHDFLAKVIIPRHNAWLHSRSKQMTHRILSRFRTKILWRYPGWF